MKESRWNSWSENARRFSSKLASPTRTRSWPIMSNKKGPTRRHVLQSGSALAAAAMAPAHAAPEPVEPADLHWLGGKRSTCDAGLMWGTPWPRGKLSKGTTFRLTSASGETVPVQSWPLAYWPDGSLKWTGHAASGPIDAEALRLEPGQPHKPAQPLTVEQTPTKVTLRSGDCVCVIPTSGPVLIESLGRQQATTVKLVCLREERNEPDTKRTRR